MKILGGIIDEFLVADYPCTVAVCVLETYFAFRCFKQELLSVCFFIGWKLQADSKENR